MFQNRKTCQRSVLICRKGSYFGQIGHSFDIKMEIKTWQHKLHMLP